MKRRHLSAVIVLGLATAFTAPSYARGIRTDTSVDGGSNWACQSVSPSDIWVTMTAGSPGETATLEPGLSTFANSLCAPSFSNLDDFGGGNQGPFTISESGSSIYSWANELQVADFTLDPDADGNQSGNDNLLGNRNSTNYGGDSEIQFNFLAADGTTCLVNSSTQPYEPEFMLGGKTYEFTQGIAQLCDPSSTSDMLFNGTNLVGYIDASGNVQAGLAPGWNLVSSTRVPEPGTLGLISLGLIATAFARRKRASRTAR